MPVAKSSFSVHAPITRKLCSNPRWDRLIVAHVQMVFAQVKYISGHAETRTGKKIEARPRSPRIERRRSSSA